MAYVTRKQLLGLDTSEVAQAPYNLAGEENDSLRPEFIMRSDLHRSVVLDDKWKEPVLTGTTYRDLTKVEEFIVSAVGGAEDTAKTFIPGVQSATGDVILTTSDAGDRLVIDAIKQQNPGREQEIDTVINSLKGREYPWEKWARRMIEAAADKKEFVELSRAIYNREHGIDPEAWSNQFAASVGSIVPAIAVSVGTGGYGTIPFLAGQFAGEYSLGTAAEYRERTGDTTFGNFTAQDAKLASTVVYAGINTIISGSFGAEAAIAAGMRRAGLKGAVKKLALRAGLKGGLSEAITEFVDPLSEQLMRTVDNTSTKTWGEAIEEAITGAVFGFLTGGVLGSAAYHVNRANLRKAIRANMPNLSEAKVNEVADIVLDMAGETVLPNKRLYNNLREKVAAIYEGVEIDDLDATIDATTRLEYSLLVNDAAERGIKLEDHPIFQGEVNELGWFRAGIPENRRAEINQYIDAIKALKNTLAELNATETKDWEKIEATEGQLSAARQNALAKLGDMVIADKAELRRMLAEQQARMRERGVKQELARKAKKNKTQDRRATRQAIRDLKQEISSGKALAISEDNWATSNQKAIDAWQKRVAQKKINRRIRENRPKLPGNATVPSELNGKTSFKHLNETFDVTKNPQGYLIELKTNGRVAASMQINNNGYVEYTHADKEGRGFAVDMVLTAEALLEPVVGPFNVSIVEGNTNAEDLWFGLGYTEFIGPRRFVRAKPEGQKSARENLPLFQQSLDLAKEMQRLDDMYPAHEGDTIVVDGKERTVFNSEGNRIAQSAEALTNFWRWFGDSKVVDEQGRPLIVYHGTDSKFDTFDKSKNWHGGLTYGKGFYFTPQKSLAQEYGKNIISAYIKATKPVESYDRFLSQSTIDSFIGYGYDAVFGLTSNDKIDEIVVFEPNQIKSTDNRGTFDPKDDRFKYQQAQGRASSTKATGKSDWVRGMYLPEYRFIARTSGMDASTLSHELAHDWFQENYRYARSGKASKDFLRTWGALEQALGLDPKDQKSFNRASEAFARAYEGWILNKKDWDKNIRVDEKDKDKIVSLFKKYQESLREIYDSLNNQYFMEAWGPDARLKPELEAWFERAAGVENLDALERRGEITTEDAAHVRLDNTIDAAVESMDAATAQAVKTARALNDTSRYEAEGGNKNALQRRLSSLAREIDENNAILNPKYDTRRDMMAVAEAADNFVKTRQQDALDIINGIKAEEEGLFASDLYTALERLAIENNDISLIEELKSSKIANGLAKELGQRVAGFRNWKAGGIDVISTLRSLDKQFARAAESTRGKEQISEAQALLAESMKEQDVKAEKGLSDFLDSLECK